MLKTKLRINLNILKHKAKKIEDLYIKNMITKFVDDNLKLVSKIEADKCIFCLGEANEENQIISSKCCKTKMHAECAYFSYITAKVIRCPICKNKDFLNWNNNRSENYKYAFNNIPYYE